MYFLFDLKCKKLNVCIKLKDRNDKNVINIMVLLLQKYILNIML